MTPKPIIRGKFWEGALIWGLFQSRSSPRPFAMSRRLPPLVKKAGHKRRADARRAARQASGDDE